ncbi:MAG: D-glycero-beta-D-manno-heptose-7-phosphate kinase [Phreatobacter sp.]|uniref:D-glycero-beta-D-manno-heptose-7-phosphate kinase n=1 Tax=Phreatobacter sp. TaxID=1966341 RepID=UPI001A5BD733|nr:D-glycero-beta-D-manno-heptose-7-phosphate kinase [Phreatobacter sp.]MBL8571872.1 D-glycero-beta-D-manno-heptose-7-phosphate kinase [Phreatobacter sp.]
MSAPQSLADVVDRLPGVRVLCVGDVMLDRFIYGRVERISPEAPIPVIRVDREQAMLGGAGNVVRNLVALGARVEFVSVVGKDAAGRDVMRLVGELPGVEPHLLVDPQRPTTIKSRFVADGHQLLRADQESSAALDGVTARDIQGVIAEAVRDCDIVVLSDYAKGVLAEDTTRQVIAAARKAGKAVLIDPKGSNWSRYKGASILTPNRPELALAAGAAVDDAAAIAAAARKLIRTLQLDAILCTRGKDGMALVGRTGKPHLLPASAREVFDVSGAGDTAIAAFAAALAAKADLPTAALLANVAAGIVVGKVGTAVVHPDEIKRELVHEANVATEAKILTAAQAADQTTRWRRLGLKVGFTNGVFDLLHPGHVTLLRKARAACDRLIVGMNSDASVKRLKGKDRPIQDEAARATVLASLASVDGVVVFGEDTPLQLIQQIRPELLVKGADYTIDKVVGAREVQSWGGKVVLVDLEQGHSTTRLVGKASGKP